MTASADFRADVALERGFRLGELLIDPAAGEVTGPGGREYLDPKVMDVFVLLARHAGHVVPREELLARLWPNTVVTDDVLSRCIYELRRQLSQAGGDEQLKALIDTVPKRGYRLTGEIVPLEPPATGPAPRGWRRLAPVVAVTAAVVAFLWFTLARQPNDRPAAPASTPSIAVLPFVDMSETQDQTYLSDGIAEEILNRLAQIPGLRVIARTSSFVFRDQKTDVREIAARLGVSHVLEGSVRRSGNELRITAQLVEAKNSSHLWSRTYDRSLGDLFAAQDEIAESVAEALDLALVEGNRRPARPVGDEAHSLLLQGQFLFHRRGPGDLELAAKYYRDAIALEPGYAGAWAGLAAVYYLMADRGIMPWDEARAQQLVAARKAIELDPELAEGHWRLAQYYFEGGELATASRHFAKAQALDPTIPKPVDIPDPARRRQEWIRAGIAEARQLLLRDPLSAVAHSNLGVFLMAAGNLDEAEAEIRKALELSPDFGAILESEFARILVLRKRPEEAYAAALLLPEGAIRDEVLALSFDAPGHRSDADEALARLADNLVLDPIRYIRLADAYAWRGMTEEAMTTLEHYRDALDVADGRTPARIWWIHQEIMVSPFLTPLETHPRWNALMAVPS